MLGNVRNHDTFLFVRVVGEWTVIVTSSVERVCSRLYVLLSFQGSRISDWSILSSQCEVSYMQYGGKWKAGGRACWKIKRTRLGLFEIPFIFLLPASAQSRVTIRRFGWVKARCPDDFIDDLFGCSSQRLRLVW